MNAERSSSVAQVVNVSSNWSTTQEKASARAVEPADRRLERILRVSRQHPAELVHRVLPGTHRNLGPSIAPREESRLERRNRPAAIMMISRSRRHPPHRGCRPAPSAPRARPQAARGRRSTPSRPLRIARALCTGTFRPARRLGRRPVEAAELQPDGVVRELEVGCMRSLPADRNSAAAARRRLASERAQSLATSWTRPGIPRRLVPSFHGPVRGVGPRRAARRPGRRRGRAGARSRWPSPRSSTRSTRARELGRRRGVAQQGRAPGPGGPTARRRGLPPPHQPPRARRRRRRRGRAASATSPLPPARIPARAIAEAAPPGPAYRTASPPACTCSAIAAASRVLPDLGRPGYEDHPARPPTGLAPRPPQPPHLGVSIHERGQRIELRREGARRSPWARRPAGLEAVRPAGRRQRLDDVDGLVEALECCWPALHEAGPRSPWPGELDDRRG